MHGMNDEVNMRQYGGLARLMPVTYVTFGLGYLAIIGIPPFSGFFTKDPIIEAAFDKGGTSGAILGTCALIGAGITAFYMTRVMLMTWYGKRRWAGEAESGEPHESTEPGAEHAGAPHPHESPAVMTWPMIVLAIGSVGAGAFLIIGERLQDFLAPVVGVPPTSHGFCQRRRASWRWCWSWPARAWPGSCTAGCRSRRSRRAGGRSPSPPARTSTATRSTSRS